MRRAAILLACTAVCAGILGMLAALHLSLNFTPSMPLGFYRTFPIDRALRRGDLVEMCLPPATARFAAQRGYLPPGPCAAETAPLLKHVAAIAGDTVDVIQAGVRVNGTYLAGSARRIRDDAERELPRIPEGRYRIATGEVWLWTPSPRGWDSRYYGPVPAANARAFARPFLVW